jgi:hypothetical protein
MPGPAGSGTACAATYRVLSVTYGTALGQPMTFNINEAIEWLRNYPGNRVTPCTVLNKYQMNAEAAYQTHKTPYPRGAAPASLIGVLQDMSYAAVTFTLDTMLAGDFSLDTGSQPHLSKQKFEFSAGDTENLSPVSVS